MLNLRRRIFLLLSVVNVVQMLSQDWFQLKLTLVN